MMLFGDLRFSTDLPVWLVFAATITTGLVVMVLYLRESSSLGSPWSWLLPAMRGTAVVLACLLLAGPVWHRRQIIGNPARIVWAIDRSESMSEADSQAENSEDRLRRAQHLLFGSGNAEGWIEQLADTHLMDVVLFDETPRLVWSSDGQSLAPEKSRSGPTSPNLSAPANFEPVTGTQTDLSSPLRGIVASGRTDTPDESASSRVVVLFSDGRDSAGRADAGPIAAQLADAGWQVHTVGMGSVDEAADVGVVDVDVPERVADDGRLAGRVWVKHFGIGSGQVRVDVRSGDDVVWSETVALQGDGKSPVDFDFPVESLMRRATGSDVRGVDRDSVALALSAEVSWIDGQESASANSSSNASGTGEVANDHNSRTANDSMSFRVAAASRDRRLLILDGAPRWETRYLRNLFARDPAWAVDTVLFGAGTDLPTVIRGEDPGELPGSARAWSRYDAVILGEVPPEQWTAEDAMGLTEFVSGGGGLIVIDGRYGRIEELMSGAGTSPPATTAFPRATGEANRSASEWMAALIPVRFGGASERGEFTTAASIQPSDAGRMHPVMLLDVGGENTAGASQSGEDAGRVWKRLPPPSLLNVVTPQPDAEVWANAIAADGARTPWLVTRLFGAGRVFYFSSDQSWRWRYKVESRLHGRFWNQLLTAAMQPPYAVRDDFVAIGTDKIDYATGDTAIIRARLLGGVATNGVASLGAPDSGLPPTTMDALLLRDDQVVATFPMRLEDAQRRTYVGETASLPAGEYRVRVQASGFDAAALKASTPIWVVPPHGSELDRVSLDETSLQRIADAGGGAYWHESSVGDLIANLQPLSGGRIVESDTLLWQSWWIFCIIVTLLGLEWWLRKKVGLI